ncbi:uncharacterized protein PAC_13669 [Phialocephala subalpina]|uniref:Apple domain-containing protein n=1 Tax=Phialocephala subalpina TaxID=576137 RepID=A0A1L7XFG2_9HELO|nr:uncharacterized protein PAC_13669 [Phialocephala subalpina]
MHPSLLLSLLPALAAAQSIEFSLISAASSVVVTAAPVTGTAQSVCAQNSAQASSVGSAAVVEKRDGTCARQPARTGPSVNHPDTTEAYFTNLHASTSTSSYMGYTILSSYDTNKCASLCTSQTGCTAFSLYFERDPTLDPNATSCPNSPSLTNIKSSGVAIAGSNGYNAVATPPSNPGFTGPIAWPGAPDCPVDPVTGISTYIGSRFFSFGVFPGQVHISIVRFVFRPARLRQLIISPMLLRDRIRKFVTMLLRMPNDNFGTPQGVYCAIFMESWDKGYGSVTAAEFGDVQWWTVGSAYVYTNATYSASYSPICQGSGCATEYASGSCGGWGAGTC